MKNKKHIDQILEKMDWQKAWKEIPVNSGQTCFEDDSRDGHISVVFSVDGDAWVSVYLPKDEGFCRHSLRYRMPMCGGGKFPRVRQALMVLAMAIKADNEEG